MGNGNRKSIANPDSLLYSLHGPKVKVRGNLEKSIVEEIDNMKYSFLFYAPHRNKYVVDKIYHQHLNVLPMLRIEYYNS